MFLSVFDCIVSHFRCIDTSLHVFLSLCLSFSVFVSVSEYIIGNWYVCDQSRSARSACNTLYKRIQSLILNHMPMGAENSATENFNFDFLIVRVLRTSLGFYFFLSLWMSVPVSSYIMTHCMCVYFSSSWYLFSCSLNIRMNRLYCDSLFVYMYVSWCMFFSLLSECLYRFSAILSLIVRV